MSLLLLLAGAGGEAPPAPVIDKVFGRGAGQSQARSEAVIGGERRGQATTGAERRGEVEPGREPT